jgi:hypothetical protein
MNVPFSHEAIALMCLPKENIEIVRSALFQCNDRTIIWNPKGFIQIFLFAIPKIIEHLD